MCNDLKFYSFRVKCFSFFFTNLFEWTIKKELYVTIFYNSNSSITIRQNLTQYCWSHFSADDFHLLVLNCRVCTEYECELAHLSQMTFSLLVVSANGCSWTAECWNTTSPRNPGLLRFSSWWGMWSLPHDIWSHMTTATTECSAFLDWITVLLLLL